MIRFVVQMSIHVAVLVSFLSIGCLLHWIQTSLWQRQQRGRAAKGFASIAVDTSLWPSVRWSQLDSMNESRDAPRAESLKATSKHCAPGRSELPNQGWRFIGERELV